MAHSAVITGVTVDSFSSEFSDREAVNIVNGSGLSGSTHGVAVTDMWLTNGTGSGFVVLDLGGLFDVEEFTVWNYNEGDGFVNRGANSVAITYGSTSSLRSTLAGVTNFAQADGTATYAGETFTESFEARFVRIEIFNNLGGDGFTGLAEVQFDGALVPEPRSALLLSLSACSALFFRRRKVQ